MNRKVSVFPCALKICVMPSGYIFSLPLGLSGLHAAWSILQRNQFFWSSKVSKVKKMIVYRFSLYGLTIVEGGMLEMLYTYMDKIAT